MCIHAKAQWVVQQVPTTNALRDVYFADTTNGWVTCSDGIFHTHDGGYNWELQYPVSAGHLCGLSDTELWATKSRDTLLHSTDGGISWDIVTINSFTDFDSTYYCNCLFL